MKTNLFDGLPGLAVLLLCAVLPEAAQGIECPTEDRPPSGKIEMVWNERGQDLEFDRISMGVPSYEAMVVNYCRDGKTALMVGVAEPVVVAVADKPEKWGFFQFPKIYRSSSGDKIICTWNMAEDAASGYGKGGNGRRLSSDNGKTWYRSDEVVPDGVCRLPTGETVSVHTPAAVKISGLKPLEPIGVRTDGSTYNRTFTFYRYDDLPASLQGVYINRWDKDGTYSLIHASLDDENIVRYADGDLIPVVWWGEDIRLAADNSIVTGIYPAFYEQANGEVCVSGVSFYRSTDRGESWKFVGNIPYVYDPGIDPNGSKRHTYGFTEPAFEILQDGTYLTVMRTTDGNGISPMYISRSTDEGATWSYPLPFTPSGVLPRLLRLDNGVLVLASGRPGLQLRFSFDGKGEKWTDPFEMLPYNGWKESVTCGYSRLLPTGPDSFIVVYSDFKHPVGHATERKAIKVREITVSSNVK